MSELEMEVRRELEELGNNKYRYKSAVMYAPCYETALQRVMRVLEKGRGNEKTKQNRSSRL